MGYASAQHSGFQEANDASKGSATRKQKREGDRGYLSMNSERTKDDKVNCCDICKLSPSKYRFTCCLWSCCSMRCYKEHKNPPASKLSSASSSTKDHCDGPKSHASDFLEGKQMSSECVAKMRGALRDRLALKEAETELIEELGGLSEEHKRNLESPAIRKWLQSSNLRRTIRAIHSSPSPTAELSRHLQNEEFYAFVCALLALTKVDGNT